MLCQQATPFERSQIGYLLPKVVGKSIIFESSQITYLGQMSPHFIVALGHIISDQRLVIRCLRSPLFVVTKDNNISEVTEWLITGYGCYNSL